MKARSAQPISLASFVLIQLAWLIGCIAHLDVLSRLSGIFRRGDGAAAGAVRAGGAKAQPEGPYDALVAERTSELIALLDEQGRYRYVSASHLRSLGYSSAEMIGQRCLGFVHPDDQPQARGRWEEALASGVGALLCRVSHRDGSWRWVDVRIERPAQGGEPLLLLVARDVTEQQQLEQRLLLAQRTLTVGTLASSIVHDMNNVLSVIEGSAGLAAELIPADNPAHEDLAAILSASRHGADLTRRLLGFVRQQPASPQPIDLGAVMADLLPLVARICTRTVDVRAEIAPDLWPVAAERSQFEQVLINLAVNARDAMPSGGRLLVRAGNQCEGWVRVEVVDSGVGMDAEVLARAFEPFYTTKSPGRGSGLGLFTSRYIVGELGGTIAAYSAPGAGTTFTILLPRYRA